MTELVSRLSSALTESRWDDYDEIWLDAIEANSGTIEEFLDASRWAAKHKNADRAGQLLALLEPQASTFDLDMRRQYYEMLCICLPKDRDHRENLATTYEEQYGSVAGFDGYVRAVDLKRTPDPAIAIKRLQGMLQFVPGTFVFHRSGWGVGEIMEVSGLDSTATINFEQKSGHRVKLDAIPEVCDLLSAGSFKVRAWRDRAGLVETAKNDPMELIKLALETRSRPMTLTQIRELLVGSAIPSSEWSKWWSKQRNKLKKEPGIGIGGGRSATYFIEDEPQGVVDGLSRRLKGLDLKDRLHLIRDALPEVSDSERVQLEPFIDQLRRNLLRGDGTHALRLELLLFLHRIGGDDLNELPPVRDFIEAAAHPADMINLLKRSEDQEELIAMLEEESGDAWPEQMMELALHVLDTPRELLVRKLVEGDHAQLVDHWAREVNRVPKKAPMYFLWLLRLVVRDKRELVPCIDEVPAVNLFMRAVSLLDDLSLQAEHESTTRLDILVKRYRSALGGRPYTQLEAVCTSTSQASIRDLYGQVESSRGFSTTTRERMLAVILRNFPSLLAGESITQAVDDGTIYSTLEGMKKVQDELALIRGEKLPEIYQAIGDAAAMGDLSENFEYTSAIEEREKLNRRVLDLQAELDRAVPIDLESADTDRVSIGSRVELTNADTGEQESFSILGPWDSDPDLGVLSYKAPLGKALLDKFPGEEFEVKLPKGSQRYVVGKISRHADAK